MTSRLAMARSISRPGTTRRKSEYHLRIRSSASQHIFHSDNSMRNTERWEHDCTGGFPSGVESALPPHELRLKVGAPIVAMWNVAKGVTNGPILVVTHPGLQLTHIKASVLGQRGGLEKDFLTNLLIDFPMMNPNKHTIKLFSGVFALCMAPGALASCQNKPLNYAGDYVVVQEGLQLDGAEAKGPIQVSHPARIESKGGDLYTLDKFVNGTVLAGGDQDDVQAVADADYFEMSSLCSAQPFGTHALECADVEDAGYSQLTPLRVDEDCAVIQLHYSYLEPGVPGCPPGDALCTPVAYTGTWTRVGSSADSGDAFDPSSSVSGASVALPLAVLSLGAAFLI